MTEPLGPSPRVLAAFGIRDAVVRLSGGQGATWGNDTVVVKPAEDPERTRWLARLLATRPPHPRFRLPRPLPAGDDWVVAGWWAYGRLDGEPSAGRFEEVIEVSRSFHRSVRAIARPAWLDRADDIWTRAAADAWARRPVPATGVFRAQIATVLDRLRPLSLPSQLVHPDLAYNVLFARGLPPAVIDWPPMWYPAGWASAIVVVDALDSGDAGPELTGVEPLSATWVQLLLRAELFRLLVKNHASRTDARIVDRKRHHDATIRLLCSLADAIP